MNIKIVLLSFVIVVGVIIFALGKPITIIDAGETGIKVTLGKFDPVPISPGMHFHIPFIQKIIVVDSRIKILYFSNSEITPSTQTQSTLIRPAIAGLDTKGLRVLFDASIQYSLNIGQIPETISEYTLDWDQRLIVSPAQSIIRNILGEYSAEELPSKRDEIANKIRTALRMHLSNIPKQPVLLQSFELKNIILPQAVQEQIQLVQVAQQEATRAKEEIARVKEEAQKLIEQSIGEAQSKRIQAQGIADAILIEAEAKQQANNLLKQSINKELLELRTIQMQGQFNEALRNNKDAKIFLTPNGSTPNIWLNSTQEEHSVQQKIITQESQQ